MTNKVVNNFVANNFVAKHNNYRGGVHDKDNKKQRLKRERKQIRKQLKNLDTRDFFMFKIYESHFQ